MSDFYTAIIYSIFIVFGLTAPFVCTIGYMWADIYYPQLSSTIVAMIPSSLILALVAIVGYLVLDRRAPARFTAHTGITLLFACWVTLTLSWAEVPDAAWDKWNWAAKTVTFSAFLPLVIRTRVHLETFLQVMLFALAFHFVPVGVKTLISGSAYGRSLGVLRGNVGLAESSVLSTVCCALIPVVLYLRKHALLLPKGKMRDYGYIAMIGIALVAAIGTYARTALIGFAVLGTFLWIQSRNKAIFSVIAVVAAIGLGTIVSASWEERISTTADYESESSALGRILVWKWTIEYVMSHPGGGGFDSYRINRIEFPAPPNGGPPTVVFGKAFHNAYIEVLGEQGFPGLIMYLSLQLISLRCLLTTIRRTRDQPYLLWLHDLARALLTSLLTVMACSNFIGIGFQAFYWYFMTLPICLREYLYRVEKLEKESTQSTSGIRLGPRRGLVPVAR